MALSNARYSDVPSRGPTRRYYQHITRYSAAFALVADAAMLTLGGNLKKREAISARLGDVLSATYLASCVLKHYENQGRPASDLPLVEWSCRHLLYFAQEQLHGLLRNFPNRGVAALLRLLVFPRGRMYAAPGDRLGQKVVELVINPTDTRQRLTEGVFASPVPENIGYQLQSAMEMAVKVEPIEKRLRDAGAATNLPAESPAQHLARLKQKGLVTEEEASLLGNYQVLLAELIAVDDFDPAELGTRTATPAKPVKSEKQAKTKVKRKAPARKRAAKPKATGGESVQAP
jgi:acyl-CoA dehydrogenase